jgi:hypothetical protein
LKNKNTIPDDLNIVIKSIYNQHGFVCTHPLAELESTEYRACTFKINNKSVRYREAKITPTKIGQFVTLWKRIEKGPIQPFDILDDIDMVIISVRDKEHLGQFIFPKSILIEKGILTSKNKEGKRALRVYPPWDKTDSKQAQKTQQWQLNYFLEISSIESFDSIRMKSLFMQTNNIAL